MKKKIILIIVIGLFLLSLPIIAIADPVIVGSGTCGDNLTWTLDHTGLLTISGTGAMSDYSVSFTAADGYVSDTPWYVYRNRIKAADIEQGVTGIGSGAFVACSSMSDISIPDGLTRIGSDAFLDCRSLTNVTIPASVTDIEDEAFNTTGLTSIIIPDGITGISSSAFGACGNLTSVSIPNSVTSIGYGAFTSCNSLSDLILPDSVTSIEGYAFAGCRFTTFTIPDGVPYIGDNTFRYCGQLTDIIIPDSVTSIGEHAFLGCNALRLVYYSGTTEQWNNIQIGSDNDCLNAAQIICGYNPSTGIIGYGTCGDNLIWALDEEGLLTISGTGEMVSFEYGSTDAWLSNKSVIKTVMIHNGVTSIGGFAFSGCSNLTSITMPDSITAIEWYAFQNCSALENVELPRNLSSIRYWAFDHCDSLTEIYIPESVRYMDGTVFASCQNLEKIVVNESNSFFTSVDGILFSKDLQTLYQYPSAKEGIRYDIPGSVTSIMGWTFRNCSSLTEITIPNSVTYLDWGVFSGSGIVNIIIPEGITKIPPSSFLDCVSLKSIYIPNSVTEIGNYVFSGCESLVSIVVPSKKSYAYQWAMKNGYADKLLIESEIVHIGATTFPDDNFRNYVNEEIDNNPKDGCLTKSEIIHVKEIDVSNSNISNLIGLEYLTELESLNCFNNGITEIDLSRNTKLSSFTCGHCSLSSLNLYNNPNLKMINCMGNNLTSLDLSKNKALVKLYCHVNTLSSLNLSQNALLQELVCFGNNFHIIDVSNCPILNNLIHSEEQQVSEYGYDWGQMGSNKGYIRIDNQTFFLEIMTVLNIPSSLNTIEEETFTNISSQAVIIPEGCTSIGERAFAGCTNLLYVRIPASVTSYPANAFEGCNENLVIDWEGH